MSADQTWTPAPRGGLVPLHPLGFGTILGSAFSALRGNPRVLLGFAMVVQLVSSLIALGVIGAVAWASFSRLDTVQPNTDEYDAILDGSALTVGLATLGVGLLMGVLGIAVQAVVVGEVAHAVLGERMTLAGIWRRVRPVFWRLLGYYVLVTVAVAVVIALLVGITVALALGEPWSAVLFGVLAVLGGIVLYAWLGTKLFLVSSAILLERATVTGGIRRSWQLTAGRFWPTFGIIVLVNLIMSAASYVVGVPFSFLGGAATAVFAPTGESSASEAIAFALTVAASQIATLVVSSIAVVVQATSAALVYIDARMRREGLDLRLQRHLEQRDAGATALDDPYAFDPAAVPPARPAWGAGAPPFGQPPYGQAPYGQAPYGQAPYGQAPYGQPPYGQAPYGQAPYGQAPYGQAPYGQTAPHGQYGAPATPPSARPEPRYGQYAPPHAPAVAPAPDPLAAPPAPPRPSDHAGRAEGTATSDGPAAPGDGTSDGASDGSASDGSALP